MKMTKMIILMMAVMMGIAMGNIVDQTCEKTPDYNLCLSLLRSDPRISSADTPGLALILVGKIKAFGTQTLAQINNAYKTKPNLKQQLDECKKKYKTIVDDDVKTAIIAVKGNPKFAEGAITDAGLEAFACQKGLSKDQSQIIVLTERMRKMCDVTVAIITM